MKNKFRLRLLVLIVLMLFLNPLSNAFAAAGSVQVQGFITNADGSVPAVSDLTITAIVEGFDSDIQSLTNSEITAFADTAFLIFFFQTGNFAPIPDVGANIIININNTNNHQLKVITHTLTADGTQTIPDSSAGSPLPLEMPTLLSIALTPDDPDVTVPDTQQLTAMGTFEGVDSAVNISSSVTWNTTNGDAGTISTAGLFTPNLVGTTDITASSDSVTSNEITLTVSAGPAANLAIDSGNSQSGTIASELTLVVKATDVNGNAVSGADVAFAITTDPASNASLSSATVATGSDGKAQVTLTLGTVAKDYTTTATVTGIDPVTFTSTATTGPLASYTVAYDSFVSTAGAVNSITVTAKDAGGNTITNHTGVVSITATDSEATLPDDYTFETADNGVKTFNVTLETAGEQTVTATTGSISGTVVGTVVHAAATKINLTSTAIIVASDGAGDWETLTATLQDTFGNTVTIGGSIYFVTTPPVSPINFTTSTREMTEGVGTRDFNTMGTVGGDGSTDVIITATLVSPSLPVTAGTITITVVDFSVTPAESTAAIGDTIDLTVTGAQGTVSWAFSDAGVGSLGSYSGDNNENAVFTVAGAGEATITVTEGGKTSTATITAYEDVAITDLPTSTVTVEPGADSAEFAVTGGDETYTWSVTGPFEVEDSEGATFTFTAPDTDNFAGEYIVTVTDSVNTNSESFTIYVPLVIDPDEQDIAVVGHDLPLTFTVTGAEVDTPYEITIIKPDGEEELFPDNFASYEAVFGFNPPEPGGTPVPETFTMIWDVEGYDNPPIVDITVYPIINKTFAGIITDAAGVPLVGAQVTITGPERFAGQTDNTAAGTGIFSFSLEVLEAGTIAFKVEEDYHVTKVFTSDDLAADGSTQIQLSLSEASISGYVTNGQALVSLFDDTGLIIGPIDSAGQGDFEFDFATAPSVPVDYTITASAPGFSGYTTITAESFPYTGVSITMTAITAPPGDLIDELVILPIPGGEPIIVLAPVETEDIPDNPNEITSGVVWDIDKLGDGCAIVPVPCDLYDAIAVAEDEKAVFYRNIADTEWIRVPASDIIEINFNGGESLIKVKICGWSSKIVGIGTPSTSSTSSTGGGGGCFISSLSASGTSSNMMAWLSMMVILAAGILIAVNRKQKTN